MQRYVRENWFLASSGDIHGRDWSARALAWLSSLSDCRCFFFGDWVTFNICMLFGGASAWKSLLYTTFYSSRLGVHNRKRRSVFHDGVFLLSNPKKTTSESEWWKWAARRGDVKTFRFMFRLTSALYEYINSLCNSAVAASMKSIHHSRHGGVEWFKWKKVEFSPTFAARKREKTARKANCGNLLRCSRAQFLHDSLLPPIKLLIKYKLRSKSEVFCCIRKRHSAKLITRSSSLSVMWSSLFLLLSLRWETKRKRMTQLWMNFVFSLWRIDRDSSGWMKIEMLSKFSKYFVTLWRKNLWRVVTILLRCLVWI